MILLYSDAKFSIVGGVQEPSAEGTYFFTSTDNIAFRFPKYQGTAKIQFVNQDRVGLTVNTSLEPFGTIYGLERVK